MRTVILLAILASNVVSIQAEEVPRVISVTGQGSATAPPDMATVTTGVVTQGVTAAEALESNNAAMQRLMAVLKRSNVADKDIQTSGFYVNPEYQRQQRGDESPAIIGYRVTNQVQVRVRNLPNLGGILDALVKSGSNQVSGISFGIENSIGVLDQARTAAVADARRRAQLYAQSAGVLVGKVLSISEQTAIAPQPRYMNFARAAAADAVPVATGEQELQASVSIIFELKDAE